MNNKTIIEFGFRIIWRIVDILEDVITPSSIFTILYTDTQPHSLIIKYQTVS